MDWDPLKTAIAHNPKEKELIECSLAYFCALYWVGFIEHKDKQKQAKEFLKIFLPINFEIYLEVIKKSYTLDGNA